MSSPRSPGSTRESKGTASVWARLLAPCTSSAAGWVLMKRPVVEPKCGSSCLPDPIPGSASARTTSSPSRPAPHLASRDGPGHEDDRYANELDEKDALHAAGGSHLAVPGTPVQAGDGFLGRHCGTWFIRSFARNRHALVAAFTGPRRDPALQAATCGRGQWRGPVSPEADEKPKVHRRFPRLAASPRARGGVAPPGGKRRRGHRPPVGQLRPVPPLSPGDRSRVSSGESQTSRAR